MKNLTLIFALMFFCFYCSADCGFGSFKVYPSNGVFYKNSKIVITSYGMGGPHLFNKLDSVYQIYLKSGDQKIRLIKEKVFEGTTGNGQIVLRPESNLLFKEGFLYSLQIDGLVGQDTFYRDQLKIRPRNSCGEYEKLDWVANKNYDESIPVIEKSPEFIRTSFLPLGCGPSMGAHFEVSGFDESQIMVMVNFKDIESNQDFDFILPIEKGSIFVGRGMCYGIFSFKRNHNYEVRFKFYDICGNTNNQWTKPITFESPYSKANEFNFN